MSHCKSKSLRQFWSDCFETWTPILGLQVLFDSKQSDQNWLSDFDLQRLIYDATNVETRVNFDPLPPFAIHILNPLDMRIHPGPPVHGSKMHPEMPGNKYFSGFGQMWVIQSPPINSSSHQVCINIACHGSM